VRRLLESLGREEATLVFYLPLRKVSEFLELALEVLGDRDALLAREMTKIHEEFLRGTISHLRENMSTAVRKGEVTLLIRGKPKALKI
jgi:16S rRNA (cytidine1402-2'-O)-methyltransferase